MLFCYPVDEPFSHLPISTSHSIFLFSRSSVPNVDQIKNTFLFACPQSSRGVRHSRSGLCAVQSVSQRFFTPHSGFIGYGFHLAPCVQDIGGPLTLSCFRLSLIRLQCTDNLLKLGSKVIEPLHPGRLSRISTLERFSCLQILTSDRGRIAP